MAQAASQCRLRRRGIASLAAIIVGFTAVGTSADPPAVRIDWSVDGGPVNTLWPDGVGESESSSFIFDGTTVDPATGIELAYQLDADPYAGLGGNLRVFNDLDRTIDVVVRLVMEFTPIFPDGSELSGQVAIGLETLVGGGQLGSLPPALWQAVIDDQLVGPQTTLFHHPFFLANSGQGSSSTQQVFGVPFPVAGPPLNDNMGYTLRYSLTSFDTASITTNFTAGGTPLTCPGDLDIDGSVGSEDFVRMLGEWGACSDECAGDLDGDGNIGILDLLQMLAGWGACPSP